jgi:hypothetical protein
MDAESLRFADQSFDWAIVCNGLHHLARPVEGLYELERVSRQGFAILEGRDSIAIRSLVRLGIGEHRDPAGGYVYRFSRRELYKIFASTHTIARWRIHTVWVPFGSDVLRLFPTARRLCPLMNHRALLGLLSSNPEDPR